MQNISFSHSKLEVARKCFKKFKFKYIDKIKVDESAESTEFGKLIHEIAEHYTGQGKEELLALYHQFKDKYVIVDIYKLKIGLALKNIFTMYKESAEKGIKEKYFEDDIKVKYTDEIELNGKIDFRSVTEANRHIIVDYKTNKSNAFANHRNQFSMYMLLLHLKYQIPYNDMDAMAIYLSLEPEDKKGNVILNEGWNNIKKDYKLDASDISMLEMEIHAIWNKIQKCELRGEWPAKPNKFECTYCKFNHLCEDKFKE